MGSKDGSIRITVRSLVVPENPEAEFEPGKALEKIMSPGTTAGEAAREVLGRNVDWMGIMVIRHQVVAEERVLEEGDSLALYPPLDGG